MLHGSWSDLISARAGRACHAVKGLFGALRLRHKRQALLARAIRKRRELRLVEDRLAKIGPDHILCAMVVRNEAVRLPYFLAYHRRLGVQHFLIIDNDSQDGTAAFLQNEPDVTLWQTTASYRRARFGLDWLNWVLLRHGRGHWCLTLDADELLVYPHCETRDLRALTEWLDDHGQKVMPAMMLELYPKAELGAGEYQQGQDPLEVIPWFDAGNYMISLQKKLGNLWIQGGPRARNFFADDPRRAPTLNKLPLVKWHWRQAWLNSTHQILPPRLNHCFPDDGGEAISGVLLHTKFLPEILLKSADEKHRKEHFGQPEAFNSYYDSILTAPSLYEATSKRYRGWRQLEALGLLSRGGWV